ncbi:MAG TPA: LysR family transcriptional regulator [Acidimicrobiales bacterium]|nr:LysR family transcriptional regulator [Acidimicrobiales bacterium]
MDLDLRLVRYAVAVADELHFGRAAGKLHITEQTLSAQIKALEAKTGIPLFVRDRRHVEVTAAGAEFVARGRELLGAAQVMLDAVRQQWPPLRVDVVAERLAPGLVVRNFRAKFPAVPIEVRLGHLRVEAAQRLIANEAEIAFSPGTIAAPDHDYIVNTRVKLEPVGLLLPSGHPLAAYAQISIDVARRYPLLGRAPSDAHELDRWETAFLHTFGFEVADRQAGEGLSSLVEAVVSSGLPSPFSTQIALSEPGLVCRPLVDPVPVLAWSAAWRKLDGNPAVSTFVASMRQFIADEGWLNRPAIPWWAPDGHDVVEDADPLTGRLGTTTSSA